MAHWQNMTRENILKTLELSEEEFVKNGASINQMSRVFEKYKLSIRLFDLECNRIYKFEPTDYKHKGGQIFYGLAKNSHIYTINRDTMSIVKKEQLPNDFEMKISSNYYVSEKKEPIKHKMISQ